MADMTADIVPAATLYAGRVTHIRHAPFRHRFDYRLWMLAVDIDRIDDITIGRLFTHNRAGVVSLADKDHGNRDGTMLRDYVEAALSRQNLQEFGAKIVFVTMPRLFGFAFNPISFYFCYDAAGRMGAILHQVKNTFGDQIGYLMPVEDGALIRQTAPKRMHVSPFFDMRGGYRFALTAPAEKFTVSIQYGAMEQKRMTATMMLDGRAFSARALLRLLAEMPFATVKVMLAIHWQALKLFIKGAKFHSTPDQNHETVIAGEGR